MLDQRHILPVAGDQAHRHSARHLAHQVKHGAFAGAVHAGVVIGIGGVEHIQRRQDRDAARVLKILFLGRFQRDGSVGQYAVQAEVGAFQIKGIAFARRHKTFFARRYRQLIRQAAHQKALGKGIQLLHRQRADIRALSGQGGQRAKRQRHQQHQHPFHTFLSFQSGRFMLIVSAYSPRSPPRRAAWVFPVALG